MESNSTGWDCGKEDFTSELSRKFIRENWSRLYHCHSPLQQVRQTSVKDLLCRQRTDCIISMGLFQPYISIFYNYYYFTELEQKPKQNHHHQSPPKKKKKKRKQNNIWCILEYLKLSLIYNGRCHTKHDLYLGLQMHKIQNVTDAIIRIQAHKLNAAHTGVSPQALVQSCPCHLLQQPEPARCCCLVTTAQIPLPTQPTD